MRPEEKDNEHEKIYERWGELRGDGMGGGRGARLGDVFVVVNLFLFADPCMPFVN